MLNTRYMDRVFAFETKEQKIRAVIAGVVILLLIGIGIYATTPKSSAPQQPSPQTAPTAVAQQGSGFGSTSNNGATSQGSMRIYQTSSYKIFYPSTWTTKNGLVQGGGELLIMQPPGASGAFPNLEIQSTPVAVAPIANMEQLFTTFKFAKTTVKLSGADADKFSGTIPLTPPLQETAYVFAAQGKSYLIKYDYISSTVDKSQEDQFQQIISTFTLSQ